LKAKSAFGPAAAAALARMLGSATSLEEPRVG